MPLQHTILEDNILVIGVKTKRVSLSIVLVILFSSTILSNFATAENEDKVPFVVATASGPTTLDPLEADDSESMETIRQVC